MYNIEDTSVYAMSTNSCVNLLRDYINATAETTEACGILYGLGIMICCIGSQAIT